MENDLKYLFLALLISLVWMYSDAYANTGHTIHYQFKLDGQAEDYCNEKEPVPNLIVDLLPRTIQEIAGTYYIVNIDIEIDTQGSRKSLDGEYLAIMYFYEKENCKAATMKLRNGLGYTQKTQERPYYKVIKTQSISILGQLESQYSIYFQ